MTRTPAGATKSCSDKISLRLSGVPVGLLGAYNAKNINDWRISPGSLITVFGDPIYKSEYETLDVAELSSVVQTKISELIDN